MIDQHLFLFWPKKKRKHLFLWSVCQNALPTRDNLYRRKIIQTPVCGLCSSASPETTEHLFLHCPWTQRIWTHSKVHLNIFTYTPTRMDLWLANFLAQNRGLPDFEQVASLLWEIWKARNHFIFRRVQKSPDQVIDSAFALASLQKRVHQKDLKGHSSWLSPNRSWQPPPLGTMKINLDGSFPTASHRGSIAGMARDHSGRLLGGITRSVSASSACGVRQHRPRWNPKSGSPAAVGVPRPLHRVLWSTSPILSSSCTALPSGG